VISVIDQWWGGRQMADKLPRLFFEHFTDTGFAARQRARHLLYEAFFQAAEARGCVLVRAVASPVIRGSVVFHQWMGFQLEPGDVEVDGIPVPPAMTAVAVTGFASSGACAVLDLLLTAQRPGVSYGGQLIAPRTSIPVR